MPNALRAYIKSIPLTQEAIAARLGFSTTTLWRWADAPHLTHEQAEKISAEFGDVTPDELIYGRGRGRYIPVTVVLQAGIPREADERDPAESYSVSVPPGPEFEKAPLYAAKVAGESMNLVYPNGSFVVLERIICDEHSLIPGKRYHVEIERADGTRESTLKLLTRDAHHVWWLEPESTEPQFKTSVRLDQAAERGEHISIIGRVVYSMKAE